MLNFLLTQAAWLYLYFVGITSKIKWNHLEIRKGLEEKEKNFIYAFWHGRQLIFPWAYRNENVHTIVSQSKDGEIIAQVIHKFGLGTIRGSSSKRASSALLELITAIEEGKTVAFTPDGPRGPQREIAPGILYTALKTSKPILPITYSAKYKIIIRGWDNYWVPLPFNKIVINFGKPIVVHAEEEFKEKGELLKSELDRITYICDQTWNNGSRKKIYYFLYNLFLEIVSPFILLAFLIRQPKRFLSQFFIGLSYRSGSVPKVSGSTNRFPIWIHAPSLGEVRAALPFVRALKEEYPNLSIFLTSNTLTGLNEAKKSGIGDIHSFAPLDFPFIMHRFFKKVRPKIFILCESEIWPNRLRLAKANGIKIVLINGRISEKSTRKYLLSKTFSQIVLENIDRFCLREEKDFERYYSLGVPEEKMKITGNLKLDYFYFQQKSSPKKSIPESPFNSSHIVWTAASIRKGEEKMIVEAFSNLKDSFLNLKLILAPRHLEECEFIQKILSAQKIKFCFRNNVSSSADAVIWNIYGDMETAYRWSDLVFMGGSLVPIGGHNPIEPAYFGKAVLFGPHMENFSDVAELLKNLGGGILVKNSAELQKEIRSAISDREKLRKRGENAKSAIEKEAGIATRKTLEFLKRDLEEALHA